MRTFTDSYRRVKDPGFSLEKAIQWFLDDRQTELREPTWRTYRSHLQDFLAWLPEDERTLSSLTPDRVEDYVRPLKKAERTHTAMNKMIALKALSRFLAEKKAWYEGTDSSRISVLVGAKTPKPKKHGLPGYSNSELRTIMNAAETDRQRAILAVEMHGFRSKEVRMLLLKNVVFGRRGEMGHFIIEDEEATKTAAGVRIVPMEQIAHRPIMDYITGSRPEWNGQGAETLFLTDEGSPFSDSGWHSNAQRFRAKCAAEGIEFKQHRLRVTRTKQLHEADVPESAILQVLGWESPAMLRRYLGAIPASKLKTYPGTLDKIFGKAM